MRAHAPARIAHDATVALRLVELLGEQREVPRPRRVDERAQGCGGDQRHVAVEHERRCRRRASAGSACITRVPGAELLLLQRPGDRRRRRCARAPPRAPWPTTTHRRCGSSAARGVDHVREQRPAGERMQDLRQVRVHALALARGEDDDLERSARRQLHLRDLAQLADRGELRGGLGELGLGLRRFPSRPCGWRALPRRGARLPSPWPRRGRARASTCRRGP